MRSFTVTDDNETDVNQSGEQPSKLARRDAMACLGWIGTGMLFSMVGGVPRTLGAISEAEAQEKNFTFVQMSDNHIGFKAGPYQNVAGTLQTAIGKIKAMQTSPALMLHTGDITNFAKPGEFDLADQINAGAGLDIHHVPGEHDMLDPGKTLYLSRYGKGTKGDGWYSFNDHGVHFIGLVNVMHQGPDHQWLLGADQLAWLQDDLRAVSPSTPIVVFAHVPLWTIYAKWGWGTGDAPAALALLRPYGSVTLLNGHIHQIVQKVEGDIKFHTARSTAFPQPVAGTAPLPGPMLKLPAGEIGEYLGITSANLYETATPLAVTDSTLA
jgi:3',5'-cyclic AMP phosphodiesterase CpdA